MGLLNELSQQQANREMPDQMNVEGLQLFHIADAEPPNFLLVCEIESHSRAIIGVDPVRLCVGREDLLNFARMVQHALDPTPLDKNLRKAGSNRNCVEEVSTSPPPSYRSASSQPTRPPLW